MKMVRADNTAIKMYLRKPATPPDNYLAHVTKIGTPVCS